MSYGRRDVILSSSQINDPEAGKSFGITQLPKLVFFHSEVPNIFDGECFHPLPSSLSPLAGGVFAHNIRRDRTKGKNGLAPGERIIALGGTTTV